MFCQEYWAERGLETHIARFHNIYGPHGTWFGGREKAPAALLRNRTRTQPWLREVTVGRNSSRRCFARSIGRNAVWKPTLPASTTSTAPTAPGSEAARRRPPRSAVR